MTPLLTAAPKRDYESMARDCPRCHAQFAAEVQTCADCLGVLLIAFGNDGPALPEASSQRV